MLSLLDQVHSAAWSEHRSHGYRGALPNRIVSIVYHIGRGRGRFRLPVKRNGAIDETPDALGDAPELPGHRRRHLPRAVDLQGDLGSRDDTEPALAGNADQVYLPWVEPDIANRLGDRTERTQG